MFTINESLAATQKLLRELSNLSFSELKEKLFYTYGLKIKQQGSLYLLDYDQIAIKWREPYGYVCRGLILDSANDFAVVAFGLHKFFNIGEGFAANLDWSTARAVEKLDGSMVQRYWNPHTNRFEFTTRFSTFEDMKTSKISDNRTWASMVEQSLSNFPALDEQPKEETWVFEVRTPLNVVVVFAEDFSATLIAVRNNKTLQEKHVDRPEFKKLSSAKEAEEFVKDWNGAKREGLVIVDQYFNRLKCKCPSYIELHKTSTLNTWPAFIKLAASKDFEEIFETHKHLKDKILKARAAIDSLGKRHADFYNSIKHIKEKKDFAIEVNKNKDVIASIIFFMNQKSTDNYDVAFSSLLEKNFVRAVLKEMNEEETV